MLQVTRLTMNSAEIKTTGKRGPGRIGVSVTVDSAVESGQGEVVMNFTYLINYEPDIAILRLKGTAYCQDTPENVRRFFDEYRKSHVVSADLCAAALNMINMTVGMNSVFLLRPFNLPPAFRPPPLLTGKEQNLKVGNTTQLGGLAQPRPKPTTQKVQKKESSWKGKKPERKR